MQEVPVFIVYLYSFINRNGADNSRANIAQIKMRTCLVGCENKTFTEYSSPKITNKNKERYKLSSISRFHGKKI